MAAPRRAKQQGNETAVAEDEWTTRHGGGAALLPGARGALRPVGPGSRRSVLLVKLTDSALRALETPPGQRGTSSPQPKICLGGDKGYMKIPVPLSESPSGFRTFSIYRSRDGAQGSFDCVHQHVDRLGVPRLDCVGTVQEKLTICATDDSYQTTRERMAQAEEETRSRGAIVIKPGGPFNGKRTVRRLPPELMDLAPGRKRSAPLNPANTLRKAPLAGTNSAAAATTAAALRPASPAAAAAAASSGPAEALRRPMRERVVHFLALRPCKKAELVARLERDAGGVGGGGQCDRSQVFAILEQVAAPRGQDGRQQLKEAAYAEVRPDWPGYSPEERRAVQALLSRRGTQQHPPPLGLPHNAPQPRLSPAAEASRPPNHTAQKRPNASVEEDAEPSLGGQQQQQKMSQNGTKKPRVSHLTSRVPPTPCDRPEPPRREKDEGVAAAATAVAVAAAPPCQPVPDTARRKMKKRREKEREREMPAGKEMPGGAATTQGDAGMKQGDAGTSEDRITQRGRERQMDTGMQVDRGMQRDRGMQKDRETQGHRDMQRDKEVQRDKDAQIEKEMQMMRAAQRDKELLTKRVTETQRERETSKDVETQRNIETNRDQETQRDRDRQRDMETQRETVAHREGETQKDREAQRESDRERERNRERQRDRDQERQRQRLRDLERDKQRERDRERARQEEKNKQQERERQEERDKQRERERQAERDKQRERDRERQAERDKQQERERQAERDKQQERERQAERDKQQERERQEERDKQQERERQEERDKQQERERQEERDKQQERERQAEMEKRREQENSKAVTEPAEEMEVDSQGVSEEEMQYKKFKMDAREADKPELIPERASSAASNPDYKLDYVPIVTPEQRERYKADFSSEFSEYRRLHRRIDTVKRRFEQLQHKMHALAPDSREQQVGGEGRGGRGGGEGNETGGTSVIRKQVVQEYSKVKKTNPEYQQEKRRCEYLHSKLAHIKQLITDYDQSS
ncbi:uncharacterized protein LOC144721877 isoform X1 [Lampetra planeri]